LAIIATDPIPPRRSSRATPLLAIWGTVLFWGLSFVASKTILNTGVPPMTMVAIRFVVAAILLNVILRRVEPEARLMRREILPLALSGLSGITVYFFFEAQGIKLTSASHASLIIAVIPVLTLLAEAVLYRTRVGWASAVGVLLSVAGVVLVVRHPGQSVAGPTSWAGDLFMFGACVSWVVYILISKNLHTRMSELAITAYQSIFGTAFLIPLALFEMPRWVPITPLAGLSLLYLALFCSALSNFLYVFALSRLGPITVSPYINLIPVIGVVGGMVLLGETMGWSQILGGVVILGGVLLVSRPAPSRSAGAPGRTEPSPPPEG
jgi:drug/metabolite transporter (DMT)-like permease